MGFARLAEIQRINFMYIIIPNGDHKAFNCVHLLFILFNQVTIVIVKLLISFICFIFVFNQVIWSKKDTFSVTMKQSIQTGTESIEQQLQDIGKQPA